MLVSMRRTEDINTATLELKIVTVMCKTNEFK